MKCKTITVEIEIPSQHSSTRLCRDIINTFGLPEEGWREKLSELSIPMEGVILITGPSGVGKSLLLKKITEQFPNFRTPPKKVNQTISIVEELGMDDPGSVIGYLSKFGLGEPRIMIGPFAHLSDGQKERFLIALGITSGKGPLILDEFTTRLDRKTASIVALNLGKILRKERINAFVASCHDDIADFLQPDTHIHLSLDGDHSIQHKTAQADRHDFIEKLGIEISQGTIEDYKKLSHYHYENDNSDDILMLEPTIDHVVVAHDHGRLIGVNLCTRPWPTAFEKFQQFSEINKHILQSFRLIVHPQYRGIGLTRVLDVFPRPETRKLLAISAFTSFYSFPVLAGYRRVESPFETIGAKEMALQDFVMCHKENTDKPAQIVSECQNLWNSLDSERQHLLKRMTIQAACEKSVRLACFHRKIANLETSPSDMETMQSIFQNLYSNSSDEAFPILLSETVYMPMAAFVKNVEPVAKRRGIDIV